MCILYTLIFKSFPISDNSLINWSEALQPIYIAFINGNGIL